MISKIKQIGTASLRKGGCGGERRDVLPSKRYLFEVRLKSDLAQASILMGGKRDGGKTAAADARLISAAISHYTG